MAKTLEGDRYALCEKHVIVPFCCSYQVYRYLAGCFGLISCRHYLKEFRNTSTNFVVLDEICGCEVPGFEGESTKMWCEGSGDFMTAWGSHVRLCGGNTAYMILLFLLLRFAIFSKISPFSPHQRGICVCLLFGIGHICAMAVRSSLRNAFESAYISYGFKSLTYDGSMD